MSIDRQYFLRALQLRNIRCIREIFLEIEPGINVFAGSNGSGKTTLLEAIHMLGTARSFRAKGAADLIKWGEEGLVSDGRFVGAGGVGRRVRVKKWKGKTAVSVDGRYLSRVSALAGLCPMVVLSPESERIISGGPEFRRSLIDWALFHVEPQYQALHLEYRRVLKQRNASLCAEQRSTIAAWSARLAHVGERLALLRASHIAEMLFFWEAYLAQLLSIEVRIQFECGWPARESLDTWLGKETANDLRHGYTRFGPHRADLKLMVGASPARHALSRGEGKRFVYALKLAQAAYVAKKVENNRPILLLDDLPSELDSDSLAILMKAIIELNLQSFLTTVSATTFEPWQDCALKLFHVERGSLEE